jgi:hypothetical protein
MVVDLGSNNLNPNKNKKNRMKKTYSSPRLTEYGPVTSLTNLQGSPSANDVGNFNVGDPIPGGSGTGSSDGQPTP